MTVTECVYTRVHPDCTTRDLGKRGCSPPMGDMSDQSFAIDMDHDNSPTDRNRTHCDFLFVGSLSGEDDEWVVPLELKRGAVGASEARGQLQAGADTADQLVPQRADFRFHPIVVSGRMDSYERAQLRKSSHKIRFRGKHYTAERMRCRDELAAVLRRL